MLRLIKLLLILVILGMLGLAGYAYLGDMQPRPVETRLPVPLNGGN